MKRWPMLLCLGAISAAVAAAPPSTPWDSGEDGEQERFLLEAEVVAKVPLGTGITRPYRVTLRRDGVEATAAWKTVEIERTHNDAANLQKDDLYFSDRWQHEVAAYRLARLIGLDRVPVSVARTIDGETGSLTAWVSDAITERQRVEGPVALGDPAAFRAATAEMRIFDALIQNRDRTQENILIVEPGSRVWLIDHSRAFRRTARLPRRTVDRETVIAPAMRERLGALDRKTLDGALGHFLTGQQIGAILKRRDAILARAGAP